MEALIKNSSNIKFLNQAEEKSEIYLFKSLEDATVAVKDLESSYIQNRKNMQIAVIFNIDDKNFTGDIKRLSVSYEKVVFICDERNFDLKEVSDLGPKANCVLYQTSIKRIGSYKNITANIESVIYYFINNKKLSDIFGKKILFDEKLFEFDHNDESETKYVIYSNLIIKLWVEQRGSYTRWYLKILTNYTFKITKIKAYWDNGSSDKQDLELEITDFEGRTYTANLNGKDRYKLDAFRNVLRPIGNFVDDFRPLEFKQIFNQLYLESSPEEYDIIRNPGFIEDRNIYLTANEVINLEN